MTDRTLTADEINAVRTIISANATASQRFKRLSIIAWRDAAIVSLLLHGLTAREITQLRHTGLKAGGNLLVDSRWSGRRMVKLDAATRNYITRYLRLVSTDQSALFLSQRGKTLNVRTIERMVSKLGKQAGLYLVPSRLTKSAERKK